MSGVVEQMSLEEYDEKLFAEVEAEIGAAPDSDEELATLEAEVAALAEEDMLLGGEAAVAHEFTFDGADVTRETKWVRKDGQFQKVSLQESIELELANQVEEERRADAQSTSSVGRAKLSSEDSSEDEEIRSLKAEVAALELEAAAQDQEALAKIKVGLAAIQAHERVERSAARTNSDQVEKATDEIANGAAQRAVRMLTEAQSAAGEVAAVSEEPASSPSPTSSVANSSRPVVDDNIAPWIREMQQYVFSSRPL